MSKNKTQSVNTKVDSKQEEARLREKRVAEKIEAILVEEAMALQPFLSYSEYAVAPRVRLVEIDASHEAVKETSNGQTNTETKAEGAGDTDKLTEPS